MNSKTGFRETASAIIILSLSPSLLFLVGSNSARLGSGAWINSVMCFLVSLATIPLIRTYLSYYNNQNIAVSLRNALGKMAGVVISAVFAVCLVMLCALFFNEYFSKLTQMTVASYRRNNLSAFMITVCTVCAYLGIESLTRQSYITLKISFLIFGVLFAITFAGWNTDNFTPVFGTKIRYVFSDYMCLATNVGLLPFLLVCDSINNNGDTRRSVWRIVFLSNLISFFLFLLYNATVPYPMNTMFDTSLNAIFTSASSGDVMHRFDIFLVALYMLFFVVSASVLLSSVSNLFTILFGGDRKIYILITAVMVYNLSEIQFNSLLLPMMCVLTFAFTVLIVILLIAVSFFKKSKHGKTGEI